MWSSPEDAGEIGVARLVEFGEECALEARVWVLDLSVMLAPLAESDTVDVDGATWQVGTLDTGEKRVPATRTALGALRVEVRCLDRSERSPEELRQLLLQAAGCLDLDAIRNRVLPIPIAPRLEALRPWPLPVGHPLMRSHACALVGDLHFGVAVIDPPRAALVGPGHPLWDNDEPARLLRRAVLHLIEDAVAGRIPFRPRTIRGATALVVGPHPLAVSAMLLPDIHLAATGLGVAPPLTAIPLRPDLLLVGGARIDVPSDSFMPAVALPLR